MHFPCSGVINWTNMYIHKPDLVSDSTTIRRKQAPGSLLRLISRTAILSQ